MQIYSNFVSIFAQAPLFLTIKQSFMCFFQLKKTLFIRLFCTNFFKLDLDRHLKSSWIQIRKIWLRIHNPEFLCRISARLRGIASCRSSWRIRWEDIPVLFLPEMGVRSWNAFAFPVPGFLDFAFAFRVPVLGPGTCSSLLFTSIE